MKIVSTTHFFSATAAADTSACLTSLGEHAAGDWIFVCMAQDGGGTAITSTGAAGWNGVGTQGAITGTRGAVFHKKAASASETVPTFSGATEEWTGTIIVIRGLDATTAVAAWQRVDWTGVAAGHSNGGVTGSTLAASSNSGAAITYADNSMMLVFAEADVGPTLVSEIGVLTEIGKSIDAGSVTHLVGYKLLQGSGTVPNVKVRSISASAGEGGNIWTLVLTPASTTDLIPFAVADVEVVAYLGDIGAQHDQAITWADPTTRQATIDSLATSNAATTRSTGALSASPVGTATSWACAVNLGAEAWVGEIGTLPTPIDVSGDLLALQWQTTNANSAPTGSKGLGLYIEDASGNWSWFSLRKKTVLNGAHYTSVIDPATGARSDGSATRPTEIKYFGVLQHRLAGSTSSRTVWAKLLLSIGTTTLIGGGTSDPTGWQAMASCLSSWGGIDIGKRHAGASDQFQIKTDMAIGDGTHSIIADFSATSCAYPGAWDPNTPDMPDWNCGIGSRVVELVGGDASSINLGACLLSTDSAQALNLSVSPSFAGTILTDGATLVGFDIAWDASQSLGSATIRSSPTAAIGGTTLNSTTIRAGTEDALATVSNGFTANNATFVAEGATYGLRVAAAGTLNINAGTTFSGFTKDIDITATTGTVTISLEAGVTEPTYQTAGAAVDVAAPNPTLDATVLSGSRVVLYNDTTDAELDNTAPAGTSWSKVITSGASSGDTLTLHVFKEGYEEFSTSFLYAGTDSTILVSQSVHAAVASLRTELGITDYTTITEFALDITGTVEIDADDADGNTMKARLAIWYNGVLTTENGARYLRGAISILSTAAIRINVSVLDLLVENISVTYGLNFTDTDRRLYRSDGTPIYAAASAAGSIQNDYSGVPDTVETGVSGLTGPESAQLMALSNDVNVSTINNETVIGTGVEGDLWRGGV